MIRADRSKDPPIDRESNGDIEVGEPARRLNTRTHRTLNIGHSHINIKAVRTMQIHVPDLHEPTKPNPGLVAIMNARVREEALSSMMKHVREQAGMMNRIHWEERTEQTEGVVADGRSSGARPNPRSGESAASASSAMYSSPPARYDTDDAELASPESQIPESVENKGNDLDDVMNAKDGAHVKKHFNFSINGGGEWGNVPEGMRSSLAKMLRKMGMHDAAGALAGEQELQDVAQALENNPDAMLGADGVEQNWLRPTVYLF